MSEIVVLSTTDTFELAQNIAMSLVEAGDAACVNIVPGVRSIYRWQGKTHEDGELLLLIKSTGDRFEAIRATIRRLHCYDIPEIIALPITAGDIDYLRWLAGSSLLP